MIVKKQAHRPDKKINPFVGFLLFLVSIVLLLFTGPLGFIYGIFHSLLTKGFKGLGEYFLKIAISVDQLGNVLMQHLLNVLWVKKGGYAFGNRDETISSALGKNKKMGTLTAFGKMIDTILDALDANHSLNSIDYHIEPTAKIIDKLAWIHIVDKRILSTRSKGKDTYYIPGGKREMGESDAAALYREVKEELCVTMDIQSMDFVGRFEAQAHGQSPGTLVRMTCYSSEYRGELKPDSEIEEIAWLDYSDMDKISDVDKLIFEFLHQKGILS